MCNEEEDEDEEEEEEEEELNLLQLCQASRESWRGQNRVPGKTGKSTPSAGMSCPRMTDTALWLWGGGG